jgi:hypothetical protein
MCASRLKSLISANRREGRLIWIPGAKVNSPQLGVPITSGRCLKNRSQGQKRNVTKPPPRIVNKLRASPDQAPQSRWKR